MDVSAIGAGSLNASGDSLEGLLRARELLASEYEGVLACEAEFDLKNYAPSVKSYVDRASALALAGCRLALRGAGILDEGARRGEVGLNYGTGWGCLETMRLFFAKVKKGNPRFAPALPFSHSYTNSPSSVVAIEFALRGHSVTYSCGKLSSARAVTDALDFLSREKGTVVAGGSEALSGVLTGHLKASGQLCGGEDPLAESARGFVPGEGAGFVVLSSETEGPVKVREEIGSPEFVASSAATREEYESDLREFDGAEIFPLGARIGETWGASFGIACALALSVVSRGEFKTAAAVCRAGDEMALLGFVRE